MCVFLIEMLLNRKLVIFFCSDRVQKMGLFDLYKILFVCLFIFVCKINESKILN